MINISETKKNEKLTVDAIELNIDFPKRLIKKDIVILDVETEDQQITVLGYYRVGSDEIKQILFPTKISPEYLRHTPFFKKNFLSGVKIACYNTSFEKNLFSLPAHKLIELQPYKYAPKERIISLKSIDQTSSKYLPRFIKKNFGIWAFHNFSCIIKQIVLYLGLENFSNPNIKEIYMQKVVNNV